MFNFDFYNPTRIAFGKGRITDLNKYIPQQARVLVLYGGGSVKTTGTLTEVLHALGDRVVSEFAGIEPNPSYETLMQAVEVVRREKIDFLLAVGDDYYMISSSFNHVPGIPILHSKDLVNWTLIGHALNKQAPFDHFSKVQHGGGVWAPSIRYHNNEFYIYYPDPDFGIYLIKAKNIT